MDDNYASLRIRTSLHDNTFVTEKPAVFIADPQEVQAEYAACPLIFERNYLVRDDGIVVERRAMFVAPTDTTAKDMKAIQSSREVGWLNEYVQAVLRPLRATQGRLKPAWRREFEIDDDGINFAQMHFYDVVGRAMPATDGAASICTFSDASLESQLGDLAVSVATPTNLLRRTEVIAYPTQVMAEYGARNINSTGTDLHSLPHAALGFPDHRSGSQLVPNSLLSVATSALGLMQRC